MDFVPHLLSSFHQHCLPFHHQLFRKWYPTPVRRGLFIISPTSSTLDLPLVLDKDILASIANVSLLEEVAQTLMEYFVSSIHHLVSHAVLMRMS